MTQAQTQDFWEQFEVVEYDKPQYDTNYWNQYEEVSQNQMALEDSLSELPENDPYVQSQNYQTEQLANLLFTSDEIAEMEQKGKMGWVEYRQRGFVGWSDITPVLGTVKQAREAGKTLSIAKKLEKGEEVTEADKAYIKDYLRNYVELQKRGMSWSSRAASMFVQAPAFMAEFALSGGLGEIAAKGAITAATKGASKVALKGATKTAARIAGQQAVLVPMYATANYNERKLADGLNITDKGDLLFDSKQAEDNNVKNAFKGLGTGEIQVLSELSGGILGKMAGKAVGLGEKAFSKVATTNVARGISAVSAKVYNSIPKNVRVKLEASAKVVQDLGEKAAKTGESFKTKGVEFHGVAEEMGEERVEDILMTAFDLDNTEGYSADEWMDAIFPSPQQLLLEAGVFSIVGATSLATRTVFNDLTSKGYSEKEATVITQNLSEIEKENMANEILGEVKINEDITEEEVQKEADAIQLKLFGGVEKNVNEQGEEVSPATQQAAELYDMADTAGATPSQEKQAKKEWKEKGTESKYFKKWFGDSKVVDENGKPLVVYHGSKKTDIEIFESGKRGTRGINEETEGFFFSPIREAADNYAGTKYGKGKVYPVYLSMKNPYMAKDYIEIGRINKEKIDKLKQQGYDGIIFKPSDEDLKSGYYSKYNEEYVVFEPTQIKSVDNQGTFDAENPNIYYETERGRTRKTTQKNNKDGIYDKNGNFFSYKEMKEKTQNIERIDINKNDVPAFNKPDKLLDWVVELFKNHRNITIKSNGRTVLFGKNGAKRIAYKQDPKDIEQNAVYTKMKSIFENSVYYKNIPIDEKHKERAAYQEIYLSKMFLDGHPYIVRFKVDVPLNPNEKTATYNYAGHRVTDIEIAPDGSQFSKLYSSSANNIIPDSKQNLNPSVKNNELYETESESKETPKNLKEVETIATEEAEKEEEDKGVKNLFKDFKEAMQNFAEALYTETVDRFAPIQNTVKKANEKGADLGVEITDKNWNKNPYNLARMYSGLANRIWQHFKENTTARAEDGTQKITGEGFGKIIEDLYKQTKDIESDKETQLKDFEDYLIAKRFLLDLKDREGYEATEEQKLKAVQDMARLAEKYGEDMTTLEKLADRVYEYNRRTLHLLVDSGNMSQETYNNIIEKNPHHISYKRIMDENYGNTGLSFAKGKFTDAKSPVKKIRGSEREIQSIYKSTLEDTMRIIDVAERNYIARKTAELQKYLPEEIKPIKPLMRKTTAKVKVTYDAKMRQQLLAAIDFFGRTFENVKSIKTPKGYALGSYSEQEKLIRKKLGSQDRTLAHEVGHMLDFALNVENKVKKNPAIMREIKTLAEDRFQTVVTLQDGEFDTEVINEGNYDYIKSNKEAIANAFDLYFTSRDYVKRVAPETAKFIEGLFKGKYAFLNEIRPSSETATEEIEQDVWATSPEKPSKNAIGYYENGKLKFVEVEPNLMRSIEDLNPKQYGMIVQAVDKLFKTSSDWLRSGATLNPEFILRNPIRDVQEAWFNVEGFNPIIDVPKGLMAVIGKNNSNLYKEWQREGGSFNSYMELNEKTINEAIKLYEDKKPLIWKALGFVPNTLEKLSSTLEESTRLGIYNAMLRKGLTPTQAAFMSREGTLDFARGGRFIKQANRYLTFLNAGVQGTDRVLRTIIRNPKQALKVGMTMAMGQILLSGYYLYLAPDDDRQEYLEIPEYVKNIAYVFKVGDKWWKIPRPFAPGYIFEAIPEKFITWLATNNKPEGLKLFNFAKDLFTASSPITDPSDFIPPMLKVWIENTSNHSFFTDRQIYPEYLNQYEPKERYNKNTSETAKLLGEKLNMSPALIENALRGQFGNAAKYTLDMGDYMQNGIKELLGEQVNEKPEDISNAWVIRGFAVKEPIGNQSQSLNTFYKNYTELSQIHNTYNKKKNENRQEAQEYKNSHSEELRKFKSINKTYKDIQELRKETGKILRNKNLGAKEKAEKIKIIEKQMTEKAQTANEFIKEE